MVWKVISEQQKMKMIATKSFENILHQIQQSSLNFHIQLSPFSAEISLKKSLIKDLNGAAFQESENIVTDDNIACQDLQAQTNTEIKKEKPIPVEIHDELLEKYSNAMKTIENLESNLKDQNETISSLKMELEKSRNSAVVLNQALMKAKTDFKNEKEYLLSVHKKEVKGWKKDLGEAVKNHMKLEKKFNLLANHNSDTESRKPQKLCMPKNNVATDTTCKQSKSVIEEDSVICSLCGNVIVEYIPDYFCGLKINPACQQCYNSDSKDDPFGAFSGKSMPTSMNSHWIPPNIGTGTPSSSLSNFPSFVSHYVKLNEPTEEESPLSREQFEELKTVLLKYFENIENKLDQLNNNL